MRYKKIVIVGTGLIGGSIGKALIRKKISKEVVGICRRESSLKRAIKNKAITSGYVNSYNAALRGADIVIIATPVNVIKNALDEISVNVNGSGMLVTDVGSTKKEIVEYASKYSKIFGFVGSHPLAGSEKTGVENSSAELFKDSVCVVAKGKYSPGSAVDAIISFWRVLGARVHVMSADKHDSILADTSHLPHAAAYALSGMQRKVNSPFVSTGFKDTTRIAASDEVLWRDIFLSNRKHMMRSIEKYKKSLSEIEECIERNDGKKLLKLLKDYRCRRNEIVGQ